MEKKNKFNSVKPKEKKFKTIVLRVLLYVVGYGFQTLYKVDPQAKDEMDSWPDTFVFVITVPNGPQMVIEKRNAKIVYKGEKEVFHSDMELSFKNIEFAFSTFTGQISIPEAGYHNRQLIKGNLNIMMSVIRVLNLIITTAYPKFIAKYYIKRVPRLTMRRLLSRGALYLNAATGFIK